jgi:predicted kinase
MSLDLFNTRNKENRFLELAFSLHQRIVIDNTNVAKVDRAPYIEQAKVNRYTVIGYYFESNLVDCLERNERRPGKEKINRVGVIAKVKNLELPMLREGFDELYTVRLENNEFAINPYDNEV